MEGNSSRGHWSRLPDNPDVERDLGYEMIEWTAVKARKNDEDHLLFMPDDEDLLRDEMFLVVDLETVRELPNCR